MKKEQPKYKLNPDYPVDSLSLNGEIIKKGDGRVLEGEQWEMWTKPNKANPKKPPKLVKVVSNKKAKKKQAKATPLVLEKKETKTSVTKNTKTLHDSTENKVEKKAEDKTVDEKYKDSIVDAFTEISGVGPGRAEMLFNAGYREIEEIAESDLKDIMKAIDSGASLAKSIRAEAEKMLKD